MRKKLLVLFLLTFIASTSLHAASKSFYRLVKGYTGKKITVWIDSGSGVFYLAGVVSKITDEYVILKDGKKNYHIRLDRISYFNN